MNVRLGFVVCLAFVTGKYLLYGGGIQISDGTVDTLDGF